MGAKKLSSSEKAAVVLLALGEDAAAQIFAGLPQVEARRIATALSRLGRLDADLVDAVMVEFHDQMTRPATGLIGDPRSAQKLLARAFGSAEELGAALNFATPAVAAAVADVPPAALAAFLAHEHPQTLALVLAHAEPRQAGDTLRLLPPALHAEVIGRIARLGPVDPEVLVDLEATLRDLALKAGPLAIQSLGGAEKVAALIATLDRAAGERLLAELDAKQPDLAEAIRRLLFTFNDLVKIDDAGMQVLLKQVPQARLKLALKSAPAAVAAHVYRNLSPRAASLLQEDVAALPKVRIADVEAAQAEVAQAARELVDAGKIQARSPDDKYV